MAVIDDNTTTKRDRDELKTIDINNTSLEEGAEQEINPNADAWEQPCPPPDGVYKCRMFLGKQGFQVGLLDDESLTKEQRTYYQCNINLKIQDEGKWKDTNIFYKVSTYIGAGKEISTMLGLCRKAGVALKELKTTPLAQCRLMAKVLKQEPQLYFEGEWKAWDDPAQAWAKQGMKTFPKSEDGKSFLHVIKDSKGGTVVAKWKVVKVYGLKEYREQLERIQKSKEQKKASAASGSSDNFKEVNAKADVNDEDLILEE